MNFRSSMQSGALLGVLLIIFSVAGCAVESDRVLMSRYAGNGYCHMKIESRGDPHTPGEREVVDYYGPCDERPSPRR